ncbi:uncharacterized protein LOC114525785 [Dendronephthya gigantea]|uniref:uncharacterized protein LOC114525785 n=1 Tax=Dendronephthya gigantea TaxID=151771 RepID=UPI00106DC3E6|nr:uncharacterized protein LOC114525785 [Dendronephthya gigantea]
MLRVFICGAHSSGKTTLLQSLLVEPGHDFHVVNEIARKILAKNRWQAEDFNPKINPATFYEFQLQILRAQWHSDVELCRQNTTYISDRGLDPIIYCKMYLGEEWFRKIMNTKEAEECIKRHKASNTLTVIIRPHRECIQEDGTRMVPKMEELVKFTEIFLEFFKEYDIQYEIIEELCLDTRVALLKSFIDAKK